MGPRPRGASNGWARACLAAPGSAAVRPTAHQQLPCSVIFDQPRMNADSPCSEVMSTVNLQRATLLILAGLVETHCEMDVHGNMAMATDGSRAVHIQIYNSAFMIPAALSTGVFGSHGSVGKLVRRHTMDSDAMQEASNSSRHGNSSGRHGSGSSTRCVGRLCALRKRRCINAIWAAFAAARVYCSLAVTTLPTAQQQLKLSDARTAWVMRMHCCVARQACRVVRRRMLPDRPEVGYCVQPNSQRVFQIPLQGDWQRRHSCGLAELHAL